jgi:formylglycine-generating enzyme required for sulfatase activity
MQPYPYGDGYHRNTQACNIDNSTPTGVDVFKAKNPNDETSRALEAMLDLSGTRKSCVSPFGVYDMVGNVDEWVVNESGRPYDSGLVGGHIFGVRNACRPMTTAHGPTFSWYETGSRCCVFP